MKSNLLRGHLRKNALALLTTVATLSVVMPTFASSASGATELGSSTHWAATGWVLEPFFTCPISDGVMASCPEGSYAEFQEGVSWQAWNESGSNIDKLTQDFWEGLIGSEAGSGEPSAMNYDGLDIYGVGAIHLD